MAGKIDVTPAAGVYVIDPEASVIRFEMQAVFGLARVTGTFAVDHGTVVVEAPSGAIRAEAMIRAASVDTANAIRDRHLRSRDYLDVGTHPEIRFRSRRIAQDGAGWTITGDLTVRGVSEPVVLTGAVAQETERAKVTAVTRIDRYAFGLTKGKGMTGRNLDLTVTVVADRRV